MSQVHLPCVSSVRGSKSAVCSSCNSCIMCCVQPHLCAWLEMAPNQAACLDPTIPPGLFGMCARLKTVGQIAMATNHGGRLSTEVDNSSPPIGERVSGRLRNEEEVHKKYGKNMSTRNGSAAHAGSQWMVSTEFCWSNFKILYNILLDCNAV